MSKKAVALFALGCVAFAGCAHMPLEMDRIQSLQSGMTQAQVREATGRAPTKQISVEVDDQAYQVDTYSMQTGSHTEVAISCTNTGCVPIPYSVAEVAPFVLVYGSEGLVAWDFVEALNKSDDSNMLAIGREVSATLERN